MPTQTFELNLFDTTRTGQLTTLLLLGIFTITGLSIWAGIQLEPAWLKVVAIVGIVGGGGYAGWQAYKRAAIVPAVVTITPTELRVEDLRPEPRLSQTVRLADVTTYLYSSYNNTKELRLNRADAPPLRLRSTGLAKTNGFAPLLAAFEQAIGATPNPTGVAARREKSFFEKPISTYLLVVFTLVVAGAFFAVFTSKGRVHGNVFGGIGAYVAYVVAWRAAAVRRNAP
ncbi:MAG: hypothetical protein ACRYFX_12455 [Janthinobacterium lividum]